MVAESRERDIAARLIMEELVGDPEPLRVLNPQHFGLISVLSTMNAWATRFRSWYNSLRHRGGPWRS
jgi:hypothetical protein